MPIKINLEEIQKKIDLECKKSARDSKEVTLIAVSKTVTADLIQEAYDLGLRHFGENRVQELLEKKVLCPNDICWHFIGTLQRKKTNKIVGEVDYIHSVDSVELAEKIAVSALEKQIDAKVLLQVNASREANKHGFDANSLLSCFDQIKACSSLKVQGLMTMAAVDADEKELHTTFSDLRELKEKIEKEYHVVLPELSMGMSHDYTIAIEEGATLIRIGRALFFDN